MRHALAVARQAAAPATGLDYLDFVRSKIITLPPLGLPVAATDIHPWLKPHCRDIVAWAIEGGRRAIFANFGLYNTVMQVAA